MKNNFIKFAVVLALICSSYFYGFISHKYELFPFYPLKLLIKGSRVDNLYKSMGYDLTYDRNKVPCNELPRNTLVLLTFGQSNAANSGNQITETSQQNIYNLNLHDEQCYLARDPLLGPTGTGGSMWLKLAEKIVEQEIHDAVLIVPIAVAATKINEWVNERYYFDRISNVQSILRSNQLEIDVSLWQQGESDSGISSNEYYKQFANMAEKMRDIGITADIVLAKSTRCRGAENVNIRLAIDKLVTDYPGLHAGPDADKYYGENYRYDNCHFNGAGLEAMSNEWLIKLSPLLTNA